MKLTVHISADYITEPDSGESVTTPLCYTAVLYQILDREAVVNIDVLEQGIYAIDNDLVELSPQNFTIPADFIGNISDCVDVTVTGNDVFDRNIRIAMLFTAQNITVTQCMIGNDVMIYRSGAYYGWFYL